MAKKSKQVKNQKVNHQRENNTDDVVSLLKVKINF